MSSESPTSIRFPARLRERVAARAAAEHRTLSGQVVHLLDEALGPEPPDEPDESPFAGQRLGAAKLVHALADLGLDDDEIAEATGLDPENIAAALAAEAA